MSEVTEVHAIVEGSTEQLFIQRMIAPHLAASNVIITPMLITKPGQKGGDVKFSRAKNDIERHLKQRNDTYVTTFVDYYGTKKDWPGLDLSPEEQQTLTTSKKAARANTATQERVTELYGAFAAQRRFIPYMAMHEFEALLFSSTSILADALEIDKAILDSILTECGTPEDINNAPTTAPSKRLNSISGRFKKTTTGIAVAERIGLPTIRAQCPLFNDWLTRLENLPPLS